MSRRHVRLARQPTPRAAQVLVDGWCRRRGRARRAPRHRRGRQRGYGDARILGPAPDNLGQHAFDPDTQRIGAVAAVRLTRGTVVHRRGARRREETRSLGRPPTSAEARRSRPPRTHANTSTRVRLSPALSAALCDATCCQIAAKRSRGQVSDVRGRPLTCKDWVELRGLEPLTPRMRSECSTLSALSGCYVIFRPRRNKTTSSRV